MYIHIDIYIHVNIYASYTQFTTPATYTHTHTPFISLPQEGANGSNHEPRLRRALATWLRNVWREILRRHCLSILTI